MRKNVLLIGALMMASMSMMAQTKVGGIRESMIQQMAKSQNGGAANKALFNAIAANNIDDLVKNHANEAPVDTHFSIETPAQSIHNQKSSGRCWMFSGFNVLRSNFALNDKQGRVVEYSQDYLFSTTSWRRLTSCFRVLSTLARRASKTLRCSSSSRTLSTMVVPSAVLPTWQASMVSYQ